MAAVVSALRILVFLYARISEDPLDQRRGVGRQIKDLRRWAIEDIGGEIAGEWVENDRSAHSGEDRPEYDKMMAAALAAAQQPGVRVVVGAYHPSRLWRQRVERAQAIEDLRTVKAFVGFESGGYFNMAKASDRSQLANLGESDTAESEVKSERVQRAALERAEEGRANGKVAYGWKRTYLHDEQGKVTGFEDSEHPEQAAIVREIVKRLLSGDTLFAITRDLNDRGVPSPGAGQQRKRRAIGQAEDGSRWSDTSVKKIATRRANIAIRCYKGDEYPAAWPALISTEQHLRVVDLFAGRGDQVTRPGQRMHLLSWGEVCTCGPCSGPIRVALRGNMKRGIRKPTYVCDGKGCVGRNEQALDDYIEAIAVEVLCDPEAADIFKGDDSAALAALERAEALRIRQSEAADDYADGILTREQLRRITQKLTREIAEAQAEAKRLQPVDLTALDGLIGPQAREKWPKLTVHQKRRALEALKFRVRIHPSSIRGPRFDHTTIDVGWHGRELAE
ncbi:recombinase family protein [Streptomyces sp. NPDC048665]|uniref:recombinase family protein n=1 Tax=Streptomyces sp. NPDC048665 TaxID=3155490 RepID=UPI00342D7003